MVMLLLPAPEPDCCADDCNCYLRPTPTLRNVLINCFVICYLFFVLCCLFFVVCCSDVTSLTVQEAVCLGRISRLGQHNQTNQIQGRMSTIS